MKNYMLKALAEAQKAGLEGEIPVGAVVVKDVPENAIAAGVPAKVISFKDENNLDFQG